MKKNTIALGFAKNGAIVFKNTQAKFTDQISRVYDFETEMFSFTVKLNKNKPTSFYKTYFPEITGILRNKGMNISIPFVEKNDVLTMKKHNNRNEVTIFECENGEYFLTYKEEFTKPYVKKYDLTLRFHFISVLKKVKNMYKIGSKEVFSVDQVEEFFAKSKLYQDKD